LDEPREIACRCPQGVDFAYGKMSPALEFTDECAAPPQREAWIIEKSVTFSMLAPSDM
jgi:hypothetical protein